MYKFISSTKFRKDIKLCKKRGFDFSEFDNILHYLNEVGYVPADYKPHKLSGYYTGCWECHIKPDWLLIWEINESDKSVYFIRTGTHSDIF